jgi:hypothetical protein
LRAQKNKQKMVDAGAPTVLQTVLTSCSGDDRAVTFACKALANLGFVCDLFELLPTLQQAFESKHKK